MTHEKPIMSHLQKISLRQWRCQVLVLGVILGLCLGCQPKSSHTLEFVPYFEGTDISCGSGVLPSSDALPLGELSFYISNLTVNNESVNFVDGGQERSSVALIGGVCNGSPRWTTSLERPVKLGDTIGFELGVPFELNHLLPLKQPAPLNNSAMFWSWQTGYKFFRLDLMAPTPWVFHLGSTGCVSESSLRPPMKPCKNPNRFSYSVKLDGSSEAVIVDLSALLKGIDVTSHQSCLSQQKRTSCQLLYNNLGQDVFRSR